MVRRPPLCIFCLSRKPSRRGEHVIPRWVSKLLDEIRGEPTTYSSVAVAGTSPEDAEVFWSVDEAKQIPITAPCVCTACNNGWLSVFETRVGNVLKPMLRGQGVALDPSARAGLAAWGEKVIVVGDYALETTHRTIRPAAAAWVYANRLSPMPSSQVTVYAAAQQATGDSKVWRTSSHVREVETDRRVLGDLHVMTMVIGPVVLQTVLVDEGEVALEHGPKWDAIASRIWPPRAGYPLGDARWPPREVIRDFAVLFEFAHTDRFDFGPRG